MTSVQFSADDLGVHPAIDREIVALIEEGHLQGCSVLAASTGLDSGVLSHLGEIPDIGIGAHLCLTEGRPLTSGFAKIPWLLTSDGTFHRHWRKLLPQLLRHPVLSRSTRTLIVEEWRAQIEQLQRLVGRVDFVDSHQNVHLLPTFYGIASEAAVLCGVRAVRTFIEPPQFRHPLMSMLRFGTRTVPTALRLPTIGLFASGEMTLTALRHALASLRPGSNAVVAVHPGRNPHHSSLPGVPPPYTLSWESESAMLRSDELLALLRERGITRTGWRHGS